jgi:hypothetical protein
MRAKPWPDETMHARFHSGVIIPPQPDQANPATMRAAADQTCFERNPWRLPLMRDRRNYGPCPNSPVAAISKPPDECWHVYYGDVRVGTMAIRVGIPFD